MSWRSRRNRHAQWGVVPSRLGRRCVCWRGVRTRKAGTLSLRRCLRERADRHQRGQRAARTPGSARSNWLVPPSDFRRIPSLLQAG